MTSTANERLIYLDDVLGEEAYGNIEHRDGGSSSLTRAEAQIQAGHQSVCVSKKARRPIDICRYSWMLPRSQMATLPSTHALRCQKGGISTVRTG